MGECDNTFCEYNCGGYCYADQDEFDECDEQFVTGDKDEEDVEDYAFSNYDSEGGLFDLEEG